VPHLVLEHWESAEHAEPFGRGLTHVPEAPGFWQKKPDWQSPLDEQAVLQAVGVPQTKLPPHGAEAPATHAFDALHVEAAVSVKPLHEVPAQSPFTLHCTHPFDVLHLGVGIMQPIGVPPLHVPVPLQLPAGVNTVPEQDALPQEVLPVGYWQAPTPSHPDAPQRPPIVQAAEQQLPLPLIPQTLLLH
jgi:hypothetical protein